MGDTYMMIKSSYTYYSIAVLSANVSIYSRYHGMRSRYLGVSGASAKDLRSSSTLDCSAVGLEPPLDSNAYVGGG